MTEGEAAGAGRDWVTERRRYAWFGESELGELHGAYERALIAYWRKDGDDRVSDRRLRELDLKARETRAAFLERLMEVAGL